jgi:hypothetical protein
MLIERLTEDLLAAAEGMPTEIHCLIAVLVTTTATPAGTARCDAERLVQCELFRTDVGECRAGEWWVKTYGGGGTRGRRQGPVEAEVMLRASKDVLAGAYQVGSWHLRENWTSFGWVMTSGPAGALRYHHGVDRRRLPHYSSQMPTSFASAAEAKAEALAAAALDPLWGAPARAD